MEMDLSDITLVIPTHNRPSYLARVLDYYAAMPVRIIVADSSADPLLKVESKKVVYKHLPQSSLTEKLSIAAEAVTTPYLVLCADDDFLLSHGLSHCLQFLRTHPDYAIAGAQSICYKKEAMLEGKVEFAVIYEDLQAYEVNDDDPLVRLHNFFHPYREAFYAVHRTEIFRKAYRQAGAVVQRLYLNEYLTAVLPIVNGKYSALPVLYQVREYVEAGGDKMAANLDALFQDAPFKKEYEGFVDFQSEKMAAAIGMSRAECKAKLDAVLLSFAAHLRDQRAAPERAPSDKAIGKMIGRLPLIGNKLIRLYRSRKRQAALQPFIKSIEEKQDLERVGDMILKHAGNFR